MSRLASLNALVRKWLRTHAGVVLMPCSCQRWRTISSGVGVCTVHSLLAHEYISIAAADAAAGCRAVDSGINVCAIGLAIKTPGL